MAIVLVTGGAGFLGRHLVAQLLQEPDTTVRVLALPHEPVPASWGAAVQVCRGDITQAADVAAAMQGCSLVYHLAALVGDGASYADHERVTAGGTATLLAAAAQQSARVVLTTSICAYGDAIQRGPCAEDTPRGRPPGPYSRAKQLQEDHAWAFAARGGLVTVVRPANIIGPGCGPWVTDACAALRQGLPALIGGGRGSAALTVADNVADGLRFVASRRDTLGQAYNLHDDLPQTWADYFNDLAGLLGTAGPKSVPRALAYLGAALTEPLCRAVLPGRRPPVTREALNLIAWPNQFPTTRLRALGWRPRVSYASALDAIAQDIRTRSL